MKLDQIAEGFHDFLNHRTFLIVMTLVVSVCTSSFAFKHGFSYNWQYGVIFAVALASLTFHFSKYFPPWLVQVLIFYTCVGLVVGTVFIGVSAWLSSATQKSDVSTVNLDRQIKILEDDRSSWRTQAFMQRAVNQITKAEQSLAKANAITKELQPLYKQKQAEQDQTYEKGNMAVFGHISKAFAWNQNQVNLAVMWFIVSVFTAMELAMGAALHTKK